jgi:TPR repeat protein
VGSGFKGKLVRLLSLGVGRHFEPQRNWGACRKMMQCNVRHVAAGLAAAVRDRAAKEAEELCASGQCAAAVVPLQRAIDFGDTASLALLAQMMIHGREGVAKDRNRAFKLVEEGARLGCHHCQGVLACCYLGGYGIQRDAERSLELARESSGRGSRYGQFVLGGFYQYGLEGVARDYAQALALYRLAAAQNLDEAQISLGWMYANGRGVARDHAEAMRLYQLAVAQGHPEALFRVASFHECGHGVPANKAEAIRWYRRAQAAGWPFAAHALQMLGV